MEQNAETLQNKDTKEIATLFYQQIKSITIRKQTIEEVTIQGEKKVYHSIFAFLGIVFC